MVLKHVLKAKKATVFICFLLRSSEGMPLRDGDFISLCKGHKVSVSFVKKRFQ